MDTQKAGQLLDRINALHKSLHLEGDGEISAIERDLMLSYLRRFYEHYQTLGEVTISRVASAPSTPKPKPSLRKPKPAPVAPAPKATPEPAPPPPPKPAPIEKSVPPPPAPAPKPAPPKPAPAPPRRASNKKVEALFAQPAVKELSDRLSRQPIKDLTRALTINNRVQYANVLFAGNSDLMNSVLQRLNSLRSMDEAKSHLIELAEQFNWPEGETKEVAQDFIKLVSRRYA